MNDFAAAFAPLLPALVEDYARHYRASAQRFIDAAAKFENPRDVFNLRGFGEAKYLILGHIWKGEAGSVNEAVVAKYAARAAAAAFDAMVAKLTKKVGSLTDIEVSHTSANFEFTITGRLGERRVMVYQSRVMNFTTQGKPYHQFPALIYVDGKKTTEANFKKLGL